MFKKLAGLTAIAGLFISGSAFAAIENSAHDFQNTVWGTDASVNITSGEICVVCHAPHNNLNDAANLLWNRNTGTVGDYIAYTNPDTLDGASNGPGNVSLLCLGCHDGTIAVDSYGGAANNTANRIDGTNFGGLAAFDTDLSNDHPIGITYSFGTGAGEDPELVDPDGADITLADTTTTGTINEVLLFSGVVECASCHDVHNTVSAGATEKLLLIDNAGSDLCLTCHNK